MADVTCKTLAFDPPETIAARSGEELDAAHQSPEAVVEPPLMNRPPPWVLHEAVFLRRRHAHEVQGVPDVREVAEAVQGVGVLPGGLHLRQFRGSAVPTLAGPRRVLPVYEAKRIAMPPGPSQLGPEIAHNRGIR